ncbi:MAG TPA: hypothetical protein VM935_17605 [Chitinophagaceae bacterium]|nr:hypothetical protein [Chitinophagaceae bacterium]
MKALVPCIVLVMLLLSCRKEIDPNGAVAPEIEKGYTSYIIKKGAHYSNQSTFQAIETRELKFMVSFDSSAVYFSKEHINQADINKLYGFSDNNANHHLYSARFGWSWINNALHIYAYVYNDGKRNITELGTIDIGKESSCSIAVGRNSYIFTLNNKSTHLGRSINTATAKGYLLYPYFGGDEVAPHDVRISIKNL